jgi:hypothetical protein
MSREIEKLEQELAGLRKYHRDAWDMYGSELCAGDMTRKEERLEKQIVDLKKKQNLYIEDPKYIIDD